MSRIFYQASAAVFIPTTTAGNIAGTVYTESDAFFTSTVGAGAVNVAGAVYTESDTFFTSTVAAGAVNISGSRYDGSVNDAFFTSTVAAGAANVVGTLYAESDAFFTSTVASAQNIGGVVYTESDAFFTSTVGAGAVNVAGSVFSEADSFYSATIIGGAVSALAGDIFSPAVIDALETSTQRVGIYFRLAVDPVARLWLGVGDCKVGINAYDDDEELYQGLGRLIDVPAVQQLINGVAERATFHVSGVSQSTLALASAEADGVKGAAVALGIGFFDGSWQQLGVPIWLFRGRADFVTLQQQSNAKGVTRVIELSVGSLFTGRRRRGFSYLTDYDQQRRSPGDKFCERTIRYSSDTNKVWPVFT